MKTLRFASAFLLFAAATLLAADVNGKWVAQVPMRNGQTREITYNFTQNGDQLTGTVTTPRGTMDISDGKVNGDEISFVQVLDFGGREIKLLYKGVVSGDEIKFTREREGGRGEGRKQEFTAKRAS